jgi:hypothetical protein
LIHAFESSESREGLTESTADRSLILPFQPRRDYIGQGTSGQATHVLFFVLPKCGRLRDASSSNPVTFVALFVSYRRQGPSSSVGREFTVWVAVRGVPLGGVRVASIIRIRLTHRMRHAVACASSILLGGLPLASKGVITDVTAAAMGKATADHVLAGAM